jgi:hypothetical protein
MTPASFSVISPRSPGVERKLPPLPLRLLQDLDL